jgi:hypothetical protein
LPGADKQRVALPVADVGRRSDDRPHRASGAAPGGVRLHLHHRAARHAGARHHHPGAAEARRQFPAWRHRGGRRGLRRVRHRLGADAVPVLAAARRALGPVRPPAGGAHFQPRPRPRLHRDGGGAVARVAVRRAGGLGHNVGEHLGRLCLRRRRDAAGRPRRPVRHAGRGLRRRLRARAGAGRACRRRRCAAAVLDRGGV